MRLARAFAFCLTVVAALPAHADLVIIANPRSGIDRLTHEEIVNIYLGRYRRMSSGTTAAPIDLVMGDRLHALFYRRLVNKTPAEINAYWARLVFSGKARPPLVAIDVDSALRTVANEPGALAYVERIHVDRRVRVVFEFEE